MRQQQRAWYWYDWANSAYVTTTATVILGPYLTSIATRAACPDLPAGQVSEALLRELYAAEGGLPLAGAPLPCPSSEAGPAAATPPPLRCA